MNIEQAFTEIEDARQKVEKELQNYHEIVQKHQRSLDIAKNLVEIANYEIKKPRSKLVAERF